MPKRRRQDQRPYKPRKVDTREPKSRFLIICEGERTEPNYFKSFRVPRDVITVEIHGTGYNTLSLVKKAIDLRNTDPEYDQVWCVFDRDSFPAQDFNEAIKLADREKMKVAYSNEAFELWYLLHFHYFNSAITRQQYIIKLNDLLSTTYRKNRPDIYAALLDKQATAIKHAQQLLQEYSPSRPERDNPSTTVHLLVKELNRFSS